MKRRTPEQDPGFANANQEDEIGENTSVTAISRRQQAAARRKTAWLPWTLLVITIVGVSLGYFWYVAPVAGQLRQQREFLAEANNNVAQLQAQVQTLKANEAALVTARADLQATLDQREQALEALQKAQEDLSQKLQAEITKCTSQPPPPVRGRRR